MPTPTTLGLLLAESQLLAIAGQSHLLSGTTDHHELILKGPGQLQKIHLLIHTEVKALEIARPNRQNRVSSFSKHFLAFLETVQAVIHAVL